jgi:SAM-dependent methyltransferase
MIRIGRDRLRAGGVADRVRLCVSDATALPFAAASFDAAYHFGGVNLFDNVGRGLAEMARVVKPGGRVVVGDEGVGPWLADSEFGRVLVNSNPLYRHQPPLALLPVSARDVACRWILNGAFYVIDFTVGEGEPFLDLDVEFPGWRGGSHRTRYYGKLDGVNPAIRQQVIDAAAARGLSVTAWLEEVLRKTLNP